MANIWEQPFGAQALPSVTGTTTPTVGDAGSGGAYGQNMFYQPGSTYGAPVSLNTSPVSAMMREKNPQLAYTQYGQNVGIADNDGAFNKWFFQQFPRFQRAQGLAVMQNPFLTIDDFMKTLPSLEMLRAQYAQATPTERGQRTALYAPIARWIPR